MFILLLLIAVVVLMFTLRNEPYTAAKSRYVPVEVKPTDIRGPERPVRRMLRKGVRATYHIGYEGRDTSTLACADKIWNSKLYSGCGQGGNPAKCRLLHYPWTAYAIGGNPNETNMCGKLIKVTNPNTRRSTIVRVVDFGAQGSDYPGGGGLDLEPAAFNAIDPKGYLAGSQKNLIVEEVRNDW